MLGEIVLTSVTYSGYFYQPIRQAFEVGKLPEYEEEERIIKKLKEESERIQPLCSSNRTQLRNEPTLILRYNYKGKLIKEENLEEPVDIRG